MFIKATYRHALACSLLVGMVSAIPVEAACPAITDGLSVRLRLAGNGAVVNCVNPNTEYRVELFGSTNNVAYCIAQPTNGIPAPVATVGFEALTKCLDASSGDVAWPRGFSIRTNSDLRSFGIVGAASPTCGNGSSSGYLQESAFSFPRCSVGGQACLAPPANAVAWYGFDETSGSTINDLAAGNDGTRFGPTSVSPGRSGRALDFDGSNDYVSIPNDSTLNFGTGDFSIEGWIKTSGNYQMIASKRAFTGGKYVGYLFMVYNNRLLLQLGDTTRSWANYLYGSGPRVNNGQWRHVAITVDRDNPFGGRMFVDGDLIYTFNPRGRGGNTSNSVNLEIGRTSGGGNYFDGSIDEPALYNRVLSASEIRGIFRAGSGGKCKPVLPQPLRVRLDCESLGGSRNICSANATGGSGGYTYSWTALFDGALFPNGRTALARLICPDSQGGRVMVRVRDSSGSVASSSDLVYCDGCDGPICPH